MHPIHIGIKLNEAAIIFTSSNACKWFCTSPKGILLSAAPRPTTGLPPPPTSACCALFLGSLPKCHMIWNVVSGQPKKYSYLLLSSVTTHHLAHMLIYHPRCYWSICSLRTRHCSLYCSTCLWKTGQNCACT